MKFERFIAVFFMLNVVLMIAAAFSAKNETVSSAMADIIYGKKVAQDYFTLTPAELQKQGFKTDAPDDIERSMSDIFENTYIKRSMIKDLEPLPPYERAVAIVKLFSLMGDGKCLTGLHIKDKINKAASKEGCAKDFAEIFTLLAQYAGLNVRMVSNGTHWGAEIFDGVKWIYIDPYFAMSAAEQDHRMSYLEFSKAMLSNGWMRFEQFGGENHCLNGKDAAGLPYFKDAKSFAEVYSLNGNNVLELNRTERRLHNRLLIVRKLMQYGMGAPEPVYTDIGDSGAALIRKYVTGLLALLAVLFISADVILPVYYLSGLFMRLTKK